MSGKKCNPHYVRNDIQYCKVVKYDWVNARVYKIMFWDITTAQLGQNISKAAFEFHIKGSWISEIIFNLVQFSHKMNIIDILNFSRYSDKFINKTFRIAILLIY